MSLTTSIIIAGIVVGLGIAIGLSVIGYFLLRLVSTIAIFKAAGTAGEAAMLNRSFNGKPPKPPELSPEKKAAEMPDIGIHEMGEDPATRKKLREKANATPESTY